MSSEGKLLDHELVAKVSEFLWDTVGDAFEYSNAHKDTIPPGLSLLDFLKERVEKTSFTPLEKELCIETSRLWGAYVGDPVERQSLKFFCLEECIDGSEFSFDCANIAVCSFGCQITTLWHLLIKPSCSMFPKQPLNMPISVSTSPLSKSIRNPEMTQRRPVKSP